MDINPGIEESVNLALAAEDFTMDEFVKYHHFLNYEKGIISKLLAHGPVLLKGGRGTGKSALLREAHRRISAGQDGSSFSVYLSLRHLPLLRSSGREYEETLLKILTDEVNAVTSTRFNYHFACEPEVYSVHRELVELSERVGKRIVLFFDDAAHIGREASLDEFFDVFRTLSSSHVSCKAAIYPGVTRFGTRFDVYNDATVVEVSRREDQDDFGKFFTAIMTTRFGEQIGQGMFSKDLPLEEVAAFLGRAVVGNVRSFVKACEALFRESRSGNVGTQVLSEALLATARDYFWPMFEEIRLKIGVYEGLIEPAERVATNLYEQCAKSGATSAILHRTVVAKFERIMGILEYASFVSRRDASRAMKSGGRGTRYVLNLCNLLELSPGSRLTRELYNQWQARDSEDAQFNTGSVIAAVSLPEIPEHRDIGILDLPVENLRKSKTFPYGITDNKLDALKEAGITTVGDLANATDEELLQLDTVGVKTVARFRSVLGQAIWM